MKSASKLFLALVCAVLMVGSASAQVTLLTENFSTAVGNMPPAGWTAITNIGTSGTEEWRFDDPGARGIPTAMTAPVAVWDDDQLSGAGGMSDGELISPVFNSSGVGTLLCQFENKHITLGNTIEVDVWDGTNWNNVFSTTASVPAGAGLGDASSELTSLDITVASGGATDARVRFHYINGTWDWYWQVDDVNIFEPAMGADVGVSAVLTPNAGSGALLCGPYSNNESVSVSVQNFAFTTLPAGTMIPIQHDVDGANIVSETFTTTGSLAFGATENYTFTTGADLTVGPGPFTVSSATLFGGDLNPANDSASAVIPPAGGGAPVPLPLSEDFGTLVGNGGIAPAGWVQDMNENSNSNLGDDWWFDNNGTGSGVGPTFDATTGVPGAGSYAHVEDSVWNPDAAAINLVTPCLDLTTAANPTLSFEVWSFDSNPAGPGTNDLNIDVISYPGGAVTSGILTVGDLGVGTWMNQSVSLSAFAGGTVRLVFRGRNDNGGGFYHDLSIDDVFVFDPTPSLGQPSAPGFATLDINGAARNGSNLPVSSGANGLYFSNLSLGGGDSLGLQIGGEPMAGLPTILFIGRSLVGGVPIPMFGTIDLDPANPFPIGIVGNGFAAPLTFFDTLYFTNASGEINITFPLTAQVMGLSPFALAAINLTPNNGGITLTNTTEITVNP